MQSFVAGQFHDQFERGIQHFVRSRIRAINLVDHDDRLQTTGQRLGEHKTRLRHGPFRRIHQQQGPIGHTDDTFHFAAEIGVAWRVNHVDLHTLVRQGNVLRQDRDPAFPLQVVCIENPFTLQLRFAKLTALSQQAVDECRFAMVNVRNDHQISNVVSSHSHISVVCGFPPPSVRHTLNSGVGGEYSLAPPAALPP